MRRFRKVFGRILAAGNAGIDCWSIRLHQSVSETGLHRGSQEDRRANLDPAWGRRPDRAYSSSALLSAKLIKNSTLKVYPGAPHGMCTTLADKVNADILGFLKKADRAAA